MSMYGIQMSYSVGFNVVSNVTDAEAYINSRHQEDRARWLVNAGDSYILNDQNYQDFLASVGNDKQAVLDSLAQGITDFGEYRVVHETAHRRLSTEWATGYKRFSGYEKDFSFDFIRYERTDNAETYNFYDALVTNWDDGKHKSVDDFLSDVRANGLSRDVNWDKFEKDTAKYGAFDSGSLAALYVTMKNRIKNDFSGGEYNEQMSYLDGIVDKRVKSMVSELLAPVVKNLGSFGVSADKVKDSFTDMFKRKVEEYSLYADRHADYAGLKNTEDTWLERDYGYMAAALINDVKNKGVVFSADRHAEGLYSENDLKALQSLSAISVDGEFWGAQVDEEQFGFKLGTVALKHSMRLDALGIGDDMKSLMNDVLKNYLDKSVKRYDYSFTIMHSVFTIQPVNEKAVYDVAERMLKTYADTKNGETALLDGAAFAYNTHMKKSASDEYATNVRYGKKKFSPYVTEDGRKIAYTTKDGIGNNHWQNFYAENDDKKSGNVIRRNIFTTDADTMKIVLADFRKFAAEVKNNPPDIDMVMVRGL